MRPRAFDRAQRFLLAPLRERAPDDVVFRALPPDDFRELRLLDALAPPRDLPDVFRELLPADFRAARARNLPEDLRDPAAELLRDRPVLLRDEPLVLAGVSPMMPPLIPALSSTLSSMRSSVSVSPRAMLLCLLVQWRWSQQSCPVTIE
jgi:hypothetical protein